MMESFPSSTMGILGQTDNSLNVQPVHSSGLTRVVHAPSARQTSKNAVDKLFTAGDDYLVRILPAQIDAPLEPLTIDDATKAITWIDADAEYLVTAAEDGCVRIYQHFVPPVDGVNAQQTSPTDLVCILSRSALPARCAALERRVPREKTPRVAVCTDELTVRIIDSGDPKNVQLLTGHERSVRAASWSPVEALLATSSCDGTVKLWNMASIDLPCIKTISNILSPSASDSELTGSVAWHPSGEQFVLPAKTHEIIIFGHAPEWRSIGTLVALDDDTIRAPTGDISAMSFCPNGRYLAVSTTDGQLTIWDWSSRKPIRSKKSSSLITAVSWHPSHDSLAWSDNAGQLTRWSDVIGPSLASPFEQVQFATSRTQKSHRVADDEREAMFDDFDVQDDDEMELLDQAETDNNESWLRSHRGGKDMARRSRYPMPASAELSTKCQSVFQSNATPMRNSRRYLCFNTIGSLIDIDQDTHHSISFESFDASARRNWRFVDHFGYSLASIGVHGALLACAERKAAGQDEEDFGDDDDDEVNGTGKDKGHASNVLFKPFEVPGGRAVPGTEWSVDLPRGENAIAVAMAGRRSSSQSSLDNCTAVVATSAGYLRFFSGGGIQRYIWAFGSQVVTMAAGNRLLLVVHRNSAAANDFQNLLYTLIDVSSLDVRQQGILPIANGATITWAGVSEMDVPAVFDSQGILLLLDRAFSSSGQGRWIPGLDTRTLAAKERQSDASDETSSRNRQVHYWPVGMDSSSLLAVMLKGSNVPDASLPSRPLIQDLPFSMPVVEGKSPKGVLEEQVLRQNQLANFARSFRSSLHPEEEEDEFYADLLEQPNAKSNTLDHEADKALLQLIQLACKNDRHQRVLDAARELHSLRTLDAAQQIGNFFHLSSLVDRMGSLRDWIAERRERDERASRAAREATLLTDMPPSQANSARVLVAGSPSPALGSNRNQAVASAKQALGREFDVAQSSRSHQGLSELAKLGQTPGSKWSKGTESNATQGHIGRESDNEEVEDEDSQGSPPASKRRSRENSDGTDAVSRTIDEPVAKRSKEMITTSPFSNKTNRDFAKPISAASTALPKNPFARTAPGLTRDRSLHKSNSFFDRVDNAATSSFPSSSTNQPSSARQGTAKTKQSTLFALTGAGRSAAAQTSLTSASAVPASTPVFGSETQQSDEGLSSEESLRLTLTAAQRRDEESQVQLEETQYGTQEQGEDEEESQDREKDFDSFDQAHHRRPSSTSISVA